MHYYGVYGHYLSRSGMHTFKSYGMYYILKQLKSLEFFSDIKLRFFGEAYVYIEIGVGAEKQIFYSEEKYFDNTLSVISIGNYVMVQPLQSGKNKFNVGGSIKGASSRFTSNLTFLFLINIYSALVRHFK